MRTSFNSLQTGKRIQSKLTHTIIWRLLCFNSLQTGKRIQRDPILHPVRPWLRNPKTKRELRGAFLSRKFHPKSRQTPINIDPNAIFQQKTLQSKTPSKFLGGLHHTQALPVNRVWNLNLSIREMHKNVNFF